MKPDSITMTNYDKAVLAQKNAKELTDAAILEIMDQMKTLLQQLTTLGLDSTTTTATTTSLRLTSTLMGDLSASWKVNKRKRNRGRPA